MHTHSAFRRISALTLVAILLLIGMPRPTSAAGQEDAEAEFIGPPVPIRVAVERAVDSFVARQAELLEGSALSPAHGALPVQNAEFTGLD